jgi:hypothetical protein
LKTYTLNISIEVDADHKDHLNERLNKSGLASILSELSESGDFEIDVESVVDYGQVLRNAALASQASKSQGSEN